MVKIDSLDHLVLTVKDIDATCAFYTQVLGMQTVVFGENRKALTFWQQKINLHQHGKEHEPKAVQPTPGSADLCLISSTPMPDILSHLQACGVTAVEGPVQRTGATGPLLSVYLRDPDQNLVEIANLLDDTTHRPIRSFVLRQGRMSKGQQRAYDELMPVFGLPYQPEVLELDQVFGRSAPRILEIGFGMGQATAEIAANHPLNDYLGVEVHGPGVGSLLKLVEERALRNVRVIQHDAVEVVSRMLATDSLDGIHIFFPDPWHKKRHNKRRLVQPPFVALLASRLKPGGYLHMATDWEEYAQYALEVLQGESSLYNTAESYAEKPAYRPLTKFENRGIKLGHGVWDLVFRKK